MKMISDQDLAGDFENISGQQSQDRGLFNDLSLDKLVNLKVSALRCTC